jgi:hypothetical protein
VPKDWGGSPGDDNCQITHAACNRHIQERNAKLVVVAVVLADASDAGIYSRPDVRLKGKRRPPVRSDMSSNDHRTVS